MADTKITALTALTAADPASDVLPIVDISDTTMAASGTTKKISINNILGASGTATLASATITGDLTVDTSTLKVDSTNNRVGVLNTPTVPFEVTGLIAASSGAFQAGAANGIFAALNNDGTNPGLDLRRWTGSANNHGTAYIATSSAGDALFYTDSQASNTKATSLRMTLNSTGLGVGGSPSYQLHVAKSQASQTAIYVDNQQNNAAASSALTLSAYGGSWNLSVPQSATFVNPLIFKFGSTETARFTSDGNLVLKGGTTTANGVGVAFPATQVASSDANTLDDYEEGTFTPTVIGTTTAGTGTYSNQTGYYTKVGRLVTITVYMNWTAHTGTGNMRFSNLPFTSANVATNYNGISIGYVNNIALTAGNVLYGLLEFGTTYVTATQSPTGGGAYSLVPIDTSAEIAFSATYFV